MNTNFDVLIVGGGPVGTRIGSKLASSGVSVAICERLPSLPGAVCCTGLVSEECLRRFEISPRLVRRSFRGARLFSPLGRQLELKRTESQAVLVDRSRLNESFAERAATSGATCLYGHEVTSLNFSANRVTADVSGRQLSARAAVLAPGFNSPLLKQAGLRRGRVWTMGAQARVSSPATEIEVYLGRRFSPGAFAWLVPAGDGSALAGLMAGGETKRKFTDFIAHLEAGGRVTEAEPVSLRGISLSTPSRTFGGRLLVAGDAAGQVKPLTGGGLYYGLLCADLAAECLRECLQANDLSARALSFYEKKWHNLLSRELHLAGLARRAFGLLNDREIDWLFALGTRFGVSEKLAQTPQIGFDWHGQALAQAWRLLAPRHLEGEKHGG
jgi:digeranylgeranylglycerophospholipid reductase